jgi:hypothetical protein
VGASKGKEKKSRFKKGGNISLHSTAQCSEALRNMRSSKLDNHILYIGNRGEKMTVTAYNIKKRSFGFALP